MQNSLDLTICTVSYKHKRHLLLNHATLLRLNPKSTSSIPWLVVENFSGESTDKLKDGEGKFVLLPGSNDTSLGASHHHAVALNSLIQHVQSRYLLVLDPDFYLLLPHWIESVLTHMREKKLAFFGVPWHPKYVENYRYFPAVHCMFIDLEQVPATTLDFRPILEADEYYEQQGILSRWAKKLFKYRWRQPWDTGARIYNRFSRTRLKYECPLPVFRLPDDWLGEIAPLQKIKSRVLEHFLPDRMCYLPKLRTSYTEIDFARRGYNIPVLPRLWEQFVWHDHPFGLHVRGSFSAAKRDQDSEYQLLEGVVESIVDTVMLGNDKGLIIPK